MLPAWGVQVCQVLAMLVFAPLISGVIAKAEARVQWRTGPSVLQPDYDIAKFFRKESLACATLAGGAALAALPPFSGFVSEWLGLEGLMQGFRVTAPARISRSPWRARCSPSPPGSPPWRSSVPPG